MSAETRRALLDWATDEDDRILDNFLDHCADEKIFDWCKVYVEGMECWNEMFDDEIEDFSAQSDMLAGIAAQSELGVLRSVAMALGVEQETLTGVIADWYEGNRGDAVGAAGLMRLCAEHEVEVREYERSPRRIYRPRTPLHRKWGKAVYRQRWTGRRYEKLA